MMTKSNNNDANILTDEELDLVSDALEENRIDNNITIPEDHNYELVEGSAEVALDKNGDPLPILYEDGIEEIKANENLNIVDINNGKLEDVNSETMVQAVKETAAVTDISDESAFKLLQIILRYQKGEKFNFYQEFPDDLKAQIDKLFKEMGGQVKKNKIAESILLNFIAETNLNKEFIDFQKAMENTLDIPSIVDMYSEHIKDVMEVKTIEMADKVEVESPEKADLLRRVSAAFTDTYKFESLINFMMANRKARNHITKDLKDYKKFCRNANMKNEKSKFMVNDVTEILPALVKVLPDVAEDDIKKFVIVFCKQVDTLNGDDVVDAAYIYYFIKNIIMLNFASEAKTDFSIQLIENIKSTIEEIKRVEDKHNEEVQNARKNKQ